MIHNTIRHVLFFPQKPNKQSVIYEILKILELHITKNRNGDFLTAINWEDVTFRKKYVFLEELNKQNNVLNINCKDISKKRVDQVFKKIFSYSISINPLEHNGKCLVKNNLNAKHDGIIKSCPLNEINQDYVYQRIIDNTNENGEFYDIRIPVFKDTIPFVYVKTKAKKTRFRDKFFSATILKTDNIFSKVEIKKINIFCRQIGMDYGELDVLRDKESNKIYIIDANNTPWGPPSELSKADAELALIELAQAFKETFLKNFNV